MCKMSPVMAENNNPENGNKVQVSTKVDPVILGIVNDIAAEEDRTISNTVERLLKTNPQVQERLETAGAGA